MWFVLFFGVCLYLVVEVRWMRCKFVVCIVLSILVSNSMLVWVRLFRLLVVCLVVLMIVFVLLSWVV